jgi:predicted nucleotidyltransferase
MVARKQINRYVREIAVRFRPRQVILFGSYAYGKPTVNSDVDLLVVMPHKAHPALQAAEIRKTVRAGFPLDLVVRSPDEVRRRLDMGDPFVREVMDKGQSLYEDLPARMD